MSHSPPSLTPTSPSLPPSLCLYYRFKNLIITRDSVAVFIQGAALVSVFPPFFHYTTRCVRPMLPLLICLRPHIIMSSSIWHYFTSEKSWMVLYQIAGFLFCSIVCLQYTDAYIDVDNVVWKVVLIYQWRVIKDFAGDLLATEITLG